MALPLVCYSTRRRRPTTGRRPRAPNSIRRRPGGRHAARLNERPAIGGHGRVVRPAAEPAIEIAPMGLRPVVHLRGRVVKASSAEADDRPQALSPEFIRRGSISRGVAMERAAPRYHAALLNECPPPFDRGRAVRHPRLGPIFF